MRLHERRLATETDVLQTAQEELRQAQNRCSDKQPVPMIVVVAEPLGAREELFADRRR